LVHNDLIGPGRPPARQLSNLAQQIEMPPKAGIAPIATGTSTLQIKAEDIVGGARSVRAAFDETASAAGIARMNQAAGQLSDQ